MSTGAQDEGAAVDVPDPRTDLPALPTTGDDQVDATLRALRQELERGDPGAAADALGDPEVRVSASKGKYGDLGTATFGADGQLRKVELPD